MGLEKIVYLVLLRLGSKSHSQHERSRIRRKSRVGVALSLVDRSFLPASGRNDVTPRPWLSRIPLANFAPKVCAFNRTVSKVDDFLAKEAKGKRRPEKNQDNYYRFLGTKVIGAHSMEEMVGKLKKPRRVMMLVKAGDAVDKFIDTLVISINLYFDLNY